MPRPIRRWGTRFLDWWKRSEWDVRTHFILLTAWVFPGLPVSYYLRNSIAWVVFISVYAIFATHWAGLDAAKPPKERKNGP